MLFFKKLAKAKIKQEKLAAFFANNTVHYNPDEHRKSQTLLYGSGGEHFLQEKYHTGQQAKEFYNRAVSKSLGSTIQKFLAQQEFLFIGTANKQGECECQFIAGETEFIHVLNEIYLIYPVFDEENLLKLKNNIHENLNIAILVMDFFKNISALHINGKAKIISCEQLLQFSNNLPAAILNKLNNSDNNNAKFWMMVEITETYQQRANNIPVLEKIKKQDTQQADKQYQSFLSYFKGNKYLFITSTFVLLCSFLFLLSPEIKPATSVQTINPAFLWHNNFWQQVTGYTILTLVIMGMFMSLHKHISIFRFIRYSWWRLIHAISGIIAIFVLILHTGLSLGNNYNFILMIFFIVTLIMGGITGILTAFDTNSEHVTQIKKLLLSSHIAVVWFLPVLLAIHILSVYYF